MLGGGLLPGTLTVVYGATGIGKTHLGLTFADHGRAADGARGVVLDMNGRGDSQQHDEYAKRLFEWDLRPWRHTVTPMSDPMPPAEAMAAFYSNALPWVGRVRDFQDNRQYMSYESSWCFSGRFVKVFRAGGVVLEKVSPFHLSGCILLLSNQNHTPL